MNSLNRKWARMNANTVRRASRPFRQAGRLLYIIFSITAASASAQTAMELFNPAAREYIVGNNTTASNLVFQALEKYPADEKLLKLKELIEQQQQQDQQQQQEEQDQQNQDKKNQDQQQRENQENQDQQNQDREREQNEQQQQDPDQQQQEEQEQADEQAQQAQPSQPRQAGQMSEEEAKQLLDAMKLNEKDLRDALRKMMEQSQPNRNRIPVQKDW